MRKDIKLWNRNKFGELGGPESLFVILIVILFCIAVCETILMEKKNKKRCNLFLVPVRPSTFRK